MRGQWVRARLLSEAEGRGHTAGRESRVRGQRMSARDQSRDGGQRAENNRHWHVERAGSRTDHRAGFKGGRRVDGSVEGRGTWQWQWAGAEGKANGQRTEEEGR